MISNAKICPFCEKGELIKIENAKRKTFHWECNHCHTYAENDLVNGNAPVISLAGAKSTTKTNYMYFLLASLKQLNKLKSFLSITNDDFPSDQIEFKYSEAIKNILGSNFIIRQNQPGEIDTIIYRLNRKGKKMYLSFKDTGGEEFESPTRIVASIPHVLQSGGIILLIDPSEFSEVRMANHGLKHEYKPARRIVQNLSDAIHMVHENSTETPEQEPETKILMDESIFGGMEASERWFAQIRKRIKEDEKSQQDSRINIPVAVCIAKFDLVMNTMGNAISNKDYFYDYVNPDMDEPIEQMVSDIEAKSNSLREELPKLGTKIVDDIEQLFSNVAYFPVILAKPDPENQEKFLNDKDFFNKGTLTPLIWLLHKLKYIQ